MKYIFLFLLFHRRRICSRHKLFLSLQIKNTAPIAAVVGKKNILILSLSFGRYFEKLVLVIVGVQKVFSNPSSVRYGYLWKVLLLFVVLLKHLLVLAVLQQVFSGQTYLFDTQDIRIPIKPACYSLYQKQWGICSLRIVNPWHSQQWYIYICNNFSFLRLFSQYKFLKKWKLKKIWVISSLSIFACYLNAGEKFFFSY